MIRPGSWRVEFLPVARRELLALRGATLDRIRAAIRALADDPTPPDSIPMRGKGEGTAPAESWQLPASSTGCRRRAFACWSFASGTGRRSIADGRGSGRKRAGLAAMGGVGGRSPAAVHFRSDT